MSIILKQKKIGFIGTGNLAQAIISGLLETKTIGTEQIVASNRTDKKLKRVEEKFGIRTLATNEEVVDFSDIIIIAVKPQDMLQAIEPIASSFTKDQLVISLAVGFALESLGKLIPDAGNIGRVMCNVAVKNKNAMMAYSLLKQGPGAADLIEEIFSPLGKIIEVPDGEAMSAFAIASSAGIGFVLELMLNWQDWIEGYGFDKETARLIVAQTFLGAVSVSTENPNLSIDDLIQQIASKKGVTEAGLQSMRESEIERILRISFEKAYIRDRELGR